ncbi:porin family protein [Mucilaginibacter sp. UYCu711]|uniref:porin family protein n=1 Tax=Mucilaginibacter sp. UYCu711 TaxID=3156339 RepID=UPI003D1A8DC5
MKTIITFITILIGFQTTRAQKVFFNLEGGVNSSQFIYGNNTHLSSSALNGYYFGSMVDITFSNFAIQPRIIFSTNGGNNLSSIEVNGSTGTISNRITLRYLLFPIDMVYRVNIGEGKIFFGAGPYFGYGLEGKNSGNTLIKGQNVDHHDYDLYFGSLQENIRNHDFGFNFLMGYEFERISMKAEYTFGLRNLSNVNSTPYSKNRIIGLGISYRFAEINIL